jgi:FkbM family methyltransferase
MLLVEAIYRKVGHYLRELHLCFQMGADQKSRLSLASDTILFHISNGLARKPGNGTARTRRHRLQLGEQQVELQLRPYCGDLFVFHEVFLDGCYHIPPAWAGDVRVVVDLGANVGMTTLYLARAFPDARFVCVEPDAHNASILRHNVSWLKDRARVLEGAVSDEPGEALFDSSDHSWGGKLLRQGETGGHAVRCFTMDEIMAAYHLDTIDILKVDIEGAEEQLFGGAGEWLSKVKLIVIELHGVYSIERFQLDVARYGFKVLPPCAEHGNRMIFAVRPTISSPQLQAASC